MLGKIFFVAKFLVHNHDLYNFVLSYVTGSQSMSQQRQIETVDKLRRDELNCLVSTNVLEEGVDVPSCNIVVRFDHFDTTKSHIQGKGRARMVGAKIFYLMNNPEIEKKKAAEMQIVAQNEALSVSAEGM